MGLEDRELGIVDVLPGALAGIWVMTSLLFVMGRSLLAAILFDNIMATVGFVTNQLSLPMDPTGGWVLAALTLIGFMLMLRFSRR